MPNSRRKFRARTHRVGADRTTHPGNIDGRLAYDIVEAAHIINTVKWLDKERTVEERHRAKVAAITLQRMPWD